MSDTCQISLTDRGVLGHRGVRISAPARADTRGRPCWRVGLGKQRTRVARARSASKGRYAGPPLLARRARKRRTATVPTRRSGVQIDAAVECVLPLVEVHAW